MFCRAFVTSMMEKWCTQLRNLAEMAQTQPQAAYAVFIQGLSSRWKHHIRSTECPPDAFGVLDNIIDMELLPALASRGFTTDQPERTLLPLPARMGGLAIPVMEKTALSEHSASLRITGPIVDLIINADAANIGMDVATRSRFNTP